MGDVIPGKFPRHDRANAPDTEERPVYLDFLTETGKLSGSELTAVAADNPVLAIQAIGDFARTFPESERPTSPEELLALVDWIGDEKLKGQFVAYISPDGNV